MITILGLHPSQTVEKMQLPTKNGLLYANIMQELISCEDCRWPTIVHVLTCQYLRIIVTWFLAH